MLQIINVLIYLSPFLHLGRLYQGLVIESFIKTSISLLSLFFVRFSNLSGKIILSLFYALAIGPGIDSIIRTYNNRNNPKKNKKKIFGFLFNLTPFFGFGYIYLEKITFFLINIAVVLYTEFGYLMPLINLIVPIFIKTPTLTTT